MFERVTEDSAKPASAPRIISPKKRWQFAVFQLRKNSAIAKLDVDNDDETLYDGEINVLDCTQDGFVLEVVSAIVFTHYWSFLIHLLNLPNLSNFASKIPLVQNVH